MPRTISTETKHRGRLFSMEVLRFRDEEGLEHEREVVRHPGAVAVVPVLSGRRGGPHLVMIRNYRVAVDRWLWEVPAGTLESGEEPAHAASRELEEETGYRPCRVSPLGSFYTSPGFADELMHVFVAEALEQVGQRLDPSESIEVELVTRDRVLEMIADGTIQDGKSIAAILMWDRWSPAGGDGRA